VLSQKIDGDFKKTNFSDPLKENPQRTSGLYLPGTNGKKKN